MSHVTLMVRADWMGFIKQESKCNKRRRRYASLAVRHEWKHINIVGALLATWR